MRAPLAFLMCLVLTGCATAPSYRAVARVNTPTPGASPSADAPPTPSPSPSISKSPPKPQPAGTGHYSSTASGTSAIFGTAGVLKRYCVQVEDLITTVAVDDFAAGVDAVLSDSRSWIAAKKWTFQRVPDCAAANVRVRLTTPASVDRFCAPTQTIGKYSCYQGGSLFINLDRWTLGVSHYPSLAEYRNLVINHEMGHFLGFQHVSCPGPGKLAPVMQRQSASLDGCVANPYPYPDGVTYVG